MKRLLPLALILLAIYFPSFKAPFLNWDDDSNIFANPNFHAGDWLAFLKQPYYGLYVPVTMWVWQALYQTGATWPFRVFNFCLHLANVALVYTFLKAYAPRGRFWGAALFALHPVQVETVAWISGGRDLLGAAFALLALQSRWPLVTSALAIFSKPSAVMMPAVAWVLGRRGWWLYVLAALGAGLALVTTFAQEEHLIAVSLWRRPLLMLDAYGFYLRKLIWPWPLAANYARTPDVIFGQPWHIVLSTATLVGAGLLVRKDQISRRAFAAWALALAPVSGLVVFGYQRLSHVADHYQYLPLAFAAIAFARASERLPRALLIVLLVLAAGVSAYRVPVWTSNRAFFTAMAEAAPESYATGMGMSVVACAEQGDFEAGVRWTEIALRARANDIRALANMAYCLLHAKRYDAVRALDFYLDRLDAETLTSTQPTAYASFLASLGAAEIELSQFREGYQYLCAANAAKPGDPVHEANLARGGEILRQHGIEPECGEEAGTPLAK